MKETACKWCVPGHKPLAENQSHILIDKPHPTNPGALIVVRRHAESPAEMTVQEWADLGEMVTMARDHLMQFRPAGFTIGWNVGESAGQHVFHAHMHVVCRFEDEPQAGRGLRDFLFRQA